MLIFQSKASAENAASSKNSSSSKKQSELTGVVNPVMVMDNEAVWIVINFYKHENIYEENFWSSTKPTTVFYNCDL